MKPPKLWDGVPELPDPVETGYLYRVIRLPRDPAIIGLIDGQLSELTYSARWRDDPLTVDREDMARYFTEIFYDYLKERTVVGEIVTLIRHNGNPDLLTCDGSTYNKADYPELAAHLDGFTPSTATTFNVPNLMGRFIWFTDDGPYEGGSTQITLTEAEMPSHAHTTIPHSHSEISALPNVTTIGPGAPQPTAVPGIAITGAAGVTVNASGGGQPHDNMPPFSAYVPFIRAR